jgi:Na+-transporting NADH:ubiquinone oxidoreductase subunit C
VDKTGACLPSIAGKGGAMNKKSPAYVIGFMVTISIVFGAAIATVYTLTSDITRQNELLNRNRSIANAFGLKAPANSATAYQIVVSDHIDHAVIDDAGKSWDVFISKDSPKNVGFIFRGIGFWDVISGIIVLTPDLSSVVGIRFLEQHETPGLGARIEEQWFLDQFPGRTIAWEQPVDRRLVIGQGTKNQKNRVDAITGATQTSMALMRMLNTDLEAFRKAYQEQTRLAHTSSPIANREKEPVWR